MTDSYASPTLETRRAQMFPVLTAEEVDRVRRFGSVRNYTDGEQLLVTGKVSPGMFVVLSGAIRVTGRDPHGYDMPVVEQGPGSFTGEIASLSGGRVFVDIAAIGNVEALLIKPRSLRAVLIAEADLGERITRALILRRLFLIESGAGGPVIIGSAKSPEVVALRSFLSRNGMPYHLLDPSTDADAGAFVTHYAAEEGDMPLVVCPDGSVLRNPTESVLGRRIGMTDSDSAEQEYDVAIAGAGPAGLATAVYAASEGLSVIVIDSHAVGGQAGASARIENYLGFPTGVSGLALAGRAYTQAQKFGARILIPAEIVHLDGDRPGSWKTLRLTLSNGAAIRSRAVVIATGARYRRPDYAGLRAMEGRGVWYWASPLEARMCSAQEVVLVGGGNSAGQAAVFLSSYASRVWMLVRGLDLAGRMSRYLIDRIAATHNIEVRTRAEIVDLSGSSHSGLEGVRWRNLQTGEEETRAVRNVFLFLGAEPSTDWLKDCGMVMDPKGFAVTGRDVPPAASEEPVASRLPLETSLPGVFAIGDARAGSIKRVGAAIGEGAAVVAQIHAFLNRQRRPAVQSGA